MDLLDEKFTDNENDIVISGISGRFPDSDSVDELRDNLLANKDMISEDTRRWPNGLYGLPNRSGKIKQLNRFDAQFFRISGEQADSTDPQGRILLEVTYEAILDSGCNPDTLRGTNTGVLIGASLAESEESLASQPDKVSGYNLTGTRRNMLANRLSYAFDLKGPSYVIDSACSSSLAALQMAYSGIRANDYDMAIVGGVNINLRPTSALELHRLNMLAVDGKCKFLDESANGYVRSEAVTALMLQKRKHAKRVYATVIHAKANSDGNKEPGITYPSQISQINLMEATLKESGVDPKWVRYVEAHGIGIQLNDQIEVNSIHQVYCKDRSDPLLVGSVKTNLGHTEPASGLCSIAKAIIAFESGLIPASLHMKTANPLIKPLMDGSIQPVLQNRKLDNSVIAVNSFGLCGTNVHVLVRPNNKVTEKYSKRDGYYFEIPRLIVANGRTEECVNNIFNFIVNNKNRANDDFLSLLTNVTNTGQSIGLDYQAYMIRDISNRNLAQISRKIVKVDDRRPVWFLLSGMGTQWTGMARGLMDIDVFNKSIRYSAEVLEPYGVDLLEIINGDKDQLLYPIVNSSVAIACIQIALIDILKALDVRADGYIGHSSGELGCAYVDGCMNAREMILSSYWRAKCIEKAKLPKGLMVAVAMQWDELRKRCPVGVVPACHNAADSVTVSGGYEEVDSFLTQLKAENIFAKKVNSNDIPFHSPYMKAIAPAMLDKLKNVLLIERPRSKRWISTSLPEDKWSAPEGKYSNAAYFVNNLISPVLFQEALQSIPKNAILIEISPSSLLKNVISHTFGPDCCYVGLMKRKNGDNNVTHLLTSIGELFNLGLRPRIESLYPKIDYPVRRGTQSLGSLIKWNHTENYLVTLYPDYFNPNPNSETVIEIDFRKDENKYYFDHLIDGQPIFPATGYVFIIWNEFARQLSTTWNQLPIVFEDIQLLRATLMPENSALVFRLSISKINGDFQLNESNRLVATGRIRVPKTGEKFLPLRQKLLQKSPELIDSQNQMNGQEVYKEMGIRGYHYGPHFKQILAFDFENNRAKLKWNNNWVTFADAVIQAYVITMSTRNLILPTYVQSLHCDPRILATNGSTDVIMNLSASYCVANGLEMYGFAGAKGQRKNPAHDLVLEKYVFIPYMDENGLNEDMRQMVGSYLELIDISIENKSNDNIVNENNILINKVNKLLAINGLTNDKLVLKDIIQNLDEKPEIASHKSQPLMASDGRRLATDLLNNIYFDESLLRPAIDIILENNNQLFATNNKEFNVLEINFNQELCHQKVVPYLRDTFYGLNIKYIAYNQAESDRIGEQDKKDFDQIDIDFTPGLIDFSNKRLMNLIIFREEFPSNDAKKADKQTVSNEVLLNYVDTNLDTNGFLLVLKRNDYTKGEKTLFTRFGYNTDKQIRDKNLFISMAEKMGLALISTRSDPISCSSVLLFRKVAKTNGNTNDLIIGIRHSEYESWSEKLKNAIRADPDSQNLIWLIADGENLSGIVGFVNCLRWEPGGQRIRCISNLMFENLINAKNTGTDLTFREVIDSKIFDNNLVMNVNKGSELGSYRFLALNSKRLTKSEARHAMMRPTRRKDNSTLQWFESNPNLNLERRLKTNNSMNILIDVYYAGLNATDLPNNSTGRKGNAIPLSSQNEKGLCSEFSGLDEFGNRFFGIKPNACLSTTLLFSNRNGLLRIPIQWSMEQACTVPMAYGQAYLALISRAQLQRKQSILIHAADGYVGRAATAVSLSRKCTVYATVGSEESKIALMANFPDLNANNIINTSIDLFKQTIIEKTFGKGIDIVFDYSDEYSFEDSLCCLRDNGRFLQVGSRSADKIGAAFTSDKNITIDRISLDQIFSESSDNTSVSSSAPNKYTVLGLIEQGISDKVVKPFNDPKVFSIDSVSQALDCLSTDRQKQKILIQIRVEDNDTNELLVNAVHNTKFQRDRSYIISGGLGGIALELAHWMVERGAKHLMLTSRNGIENSLQTYNISRLKQMGAQVVLSELNASDEKQCEELLKQTALMAPIAGIFCLAMVLSDGQFRNQTQESMEKVLAPKGEALKHLDLISRDTCPDLQYFVAFSSVASGRGNGGQSNYGYADSLMERICEQRRAEGLPAVAIQWGAIADVGVAMDTFGEETDDRAFGQTVAQPIHSCLTVLNHFLRTDAPVVTSFLRNDTRLSSNYQELDVSNK